MSCRERDTNGHLMKQGHLSAIVPGTWSCCGEFSARNGGRGTGQDEYVPHWLVFASHPRGPRFNPRHSKVSFFPCFHLLEEQSHM